MKNRVALSVALVALIAGSVGLGTASVSDSSEARQAVPKVSKREAVYYMQIALKRRLGFGAGYARVVRCRKRIDRTHVRCQKIKWNVGDLSYKGHGTIWFTKSPRGTVWNFAYKIVQTNYYCLNSDRPTRKCYKRFVVR